MLKRLLDTAVQQRLDNLKNQLSDAIRTNKRAVERVNELTAEAKRLADIRDQQEREIADQKDRIETLEQDRRRLESKLEIADERVEMLTEVIQRDRERVLAETQVYAQMGEGANFRHAGKEMGERFTGE